MTRLPLLALLALTACAAPDHCYTIRAETADCIAKHKANPSYHCECTSTTSEPRDYHAPVVPPPKVDDPVVIPPVDHDDHSEDPDRDPEKYDYWKEAGVWK